MADFAEVDGFAAPEAVPSAFGVLLGWLGALVSVALIVGLGVWGYQLAMRDVSGVPVVRALEGPMRIAPEDPGGTQAAHQGLAVNSVASDGAAQRPADRLVLAPPPLDLDDEDLPRADLNEIAEIELAPASADAAAPDAALLALADTLSQGAQPLELTEEIEAPGVEVASLSFPIPVTVPGVARSPVPVPRPAVNLTAEAIATEVALAVSRPAQEVAPDAVPAGTRLVQFGAYDNPELARDAWAVLEAKFGDFLDGKRRIVQEAVSGGKTFYRLRAMGFADINDARRFCTAIMAERQACIPVVVR